MFPFGQFVTYLIIGIIAFFTIIIITRDLTAWYLKTNELLKALQNIDDKLNLLVKDKLPEETKENEPE